MRAPSPDSGSSASRPTTPSPERDGDERLSSSTADLEAGGDDDDRSAATRSGAATPIPAVPDADGVVHKQLFRGGGGAKRGGAARGGKQKGRGRGRGRSKKMK
jgi:hypothetical protein